jgi:hypothetical protein
MRIVDGRLFGLLKVIESPIEALLIAGAEIEVLEISYPHRPLFNS